VIQTILGSPNKPLAAPWGITIALASFGPFANDLLVGNFSFVASEINAFDPLSGTLLGTILIDLASATRQAAFGPSASGPGATPAITFTSLIPDLDHYKGSFGGRVHPLWRDRSATQPNIKPALLSDLAKVYGQPVKAEDVLAYLAATMAHPAFTTRFKADLVRPGLRVPLTADAKLFAEAVALGSEVIWLHCYGERFADPKAGRPKKVPPAEGERAVPSGGWRDSVVPRTAARHDGL
jgi:hypothetical protein